MAWSSRVVVLSILVVVVAALGAPRPGGAASSPAVLTYALISTGTDKVPAFTTTGEDTQVFELIYGSLLRVDAATLKIGPSLATSYTTSADGKTWTFKLRRGVKWQRGYGEFTCADVQFTWDFNKNPANHSFWQTQASIVDNVSCPDPYTAVFHLTAPFLGFTWNVVDVEPSTGWILSKAAWDKLGRDGYEKTPVGTGPYMLQSLVPTQDIILVRNPDYWGPRPSVEEIDFKAIADSQTAALGVKTGSVDISSVDAVIAQQYAHTPGVHVVNRPAFFTDFLEINMTVKPFDDVRVRQAMRYAIDYKGLVSTVLRGYGRPGYAGLMMPGMDGYDASVNPPNTYDPDKAKALLKEAGVSLPIQGFFTTYNDTKDVNAAQYVAANLSQVGINMQARPLERGTLVQERIKPTTPASVLGTTLAPDPDFLWSLTFIGKQIPPAGLNIARYTGIDQLYEEQHTAATKAARLRALKEMQQKVAADVPAIEFWQQNSIWLVNDRVQNFEASVLFNGDPLDRVTLKP